MNFLGLLAAGFIIGLQHSFEPDHLATVSTLVARKGSLRKSTLAGVLWGLGHTLVLMFTGVLVLIFRFNIPDFFSSTFELLSGVLLIYLGAMLFKNLWFDRLSKKIEKPRGETPTDFRQLRKPLLVGMLHGLAGSAGILLLVMTGMETIADGFTLLLMFGLGSVLGMGASGLLMSFPARWISFDSIKGRFLLGAVGAVSVYFGFDLLVQNWYF